MRQAHTSYKTSNFLWILGEDFAFFMAKETYEFMEKLMEVVEELQSNVKFVYSTPSRYVKAVK